VTWTNLLANKEAQKHKTSKKELDNMRALIARDLADASLAGLSADRRFATAYNAALQAANMAIACAGYRIVSKVGHHRVSLESTKLVLGKAAHKYADYFETCRRKRNTIDYTFSNVATDTEAKEILVQARQSSGAIPPCVSITADFARVVGYPKKASVTSCVVRIALA
jgi:allantoicase